jgi:hypothetical protein
MVDSPVLRRVPALLPSLVAAIGVLVFARVVGFGFAYDDRWTLVENRWLERPITELFRLLATGEALRLHVPDATRPAMVLGEALERRVFALSPAGYHLDSLLLYALACGLATALARVVSRRHDVALFAGCFFAVAPVHTEVVAAINYREDLLAAVGTLGVLLCLCTRSRSGDSRARALGVGALAALALFGKESALSALPLLGLVVWLVPWTGAPVRASRRALVIAGVVLLAWLLWRLPLALHGDDIPLAPRRSLVQMLLRFARFEVQAVRHALFPWSVSPEHWRQPDASFGWVAPFVSLVLGVALLGREERTRLPFLGIGIAMLAPLACSPLLRPVNEHADRYFFLSVLGGGLFWGWAAAHAARSLGIPWRRRGLAVLALLPLAVVAFRAAGMWQSERTLWLAATELTPGSPRAWAGLSRVHRLAHEPDAADQAMARALAVGPEYAPALVTEIYNDLAFGRLEAARAHLAALERRGFHDEGGLGKAKACAKLDAAAAARCIDR